MRCPCISEFVALKVTYFNFVSKFITYKSLSYVVLIFLLYITFRYHISGVSTIRKGAVL